MRRIFSHTPIIRSFRQNYSTSIVETRQVFSAIQPTGQAHLGNYLGALRKWVDLQDSEKNPPIFAIADLHSITIPKDPKELKRDILLMAATVLSCGIATDKSIFFKQSDVTQHPELCWTLATLTKMTKLSQLPQFKEKCKLVKDAPVGIFLYPVLQTADIMLYRTTHVPVGEDQIHQIQLAHDLIKAFNKHFGSKFPIPDTIIDESAGRIRSLSDPDKKMSKSDPKALSAISLMDEPDLILKKVKKAVTDFKSEVTYEPQERPGVSNLVLIHSLITGKTTQEIVEESVNLDTGKYKLVFAEVLIENLNPIRKKIIEYLDSEEYLLSELEKGAERAREKAERTMKEVRERVGLTLFKTYENKVLNAVK